MWDFNKLSEKYTPFQLDKLRNHIPVKTKCPICTREFDAKSYVFRPTAIYPIVRSTCSDACKRVYGGKKNKKVFKDYVCEGCNQPFIPHHRKPHQRFCNKQCRGLALKGKPRPEMQQWIHKISPPIGSISKWGTEWLDQLNVPIREHLITVDKQKFRVDGYDPATNTVYEYLGSFWHGNPDVYDPSDTHPISNVTYGQLYNNTIDRINRLKGAGYNVIVRWSPR